MRAAPLDGSALWIAMKIAGSLSRLVRIGAGMKIRNKKIYIFTNAFKQGKNINVIQYAAGPKRVSPSSSVSCSKFCLLHFTGSVCFCWLS